MKRYKLAPLCGALLLALAACGCNRLKARDHLNKGVQDYRNAQFQPAIMHFKEAVSLDPSLLNARLYLATAYAQQYVPGNDSPDNKQFAQQAIDAFQDVLKMDPEQYHRHRQHCADLLQHEEFRQGEGLQPAPDQD